MIDIHTHLYFPQYDADRDETLRRAFDAGVKYMVSVGTGPDDWEWARDIALRDERIGLAVGIHPNSVARSKQQEVRGNAEIQIRKLREFILKNKEKVVAIGECGLDYFARGDEPVTEEHKTFQKEGFVAQIALAQEFDLPLIVHTRPGAGGMDAYEEVYKIFCTVVSPAENNFFRRPDEAWRMKGEKKNRFSPERTACQTPEAQYILHCYMGDTEVTQKFLELPNVYFSFTGNITYPVKQSLEGTKDDLHETVAMIPLERLLTETDCPFLAPQKYRGGRNEPAYVREVVEMVAHLKNISPETVERATEETACRVFGEAIQSISSCEIF